MGGIMAESAKEEIISLLENQKFGDLADLVARKRGSIRYLNRLLSNPAGLLRWRAVEAMGHVADRLADEDPEAVRIILRNLFWTINEESGGIGWSSAECIGEIISRRPECFREYVSIILSFIDEAMLRRGVLWAARSIARVLPGLVRESLPDPSIYLDDRDPVVRGYSLLLMEVLEETLDTGRHGRLLEDRSPVPVYGEGLLKEVTVAELAARIAPGPGGKSGFDAKPRC